MGHIEHNVPVVISDATVYVGGLDEKVTESILWELFLQAGPVGMYLRFHEHNENCTFSRGLVFLSSAGMVYPLSLLQ